MGDIVALPKPIIAEAPIPAMGRDSASLLYETLRPGVSACSIADLGQFRLRYPIVVSIEDYETEVIATWHEVNAWGSGATPNEAIDALKDDIVALYESLRDSDDDELGKRPLRWKRALEAVIVVE